MNKQIEVEKYLQSKQISDIKICLFLNRVKMTCLVNRNLSVRSCGNSQVLVWPSR